MKISGIYTIICSINGKFYIGSSNHIYKRKQEHFRLLKQNKHHCHYLQFAFNKYGEKSFFFIICEICPENTLLNLEQKYLDEAKQFRGQQCLNGSFIADRPETFCGNKNPMFGKHHSKKAKKILSQKSKGNKNRMQNILYKFKNIITGEIFIGTQYNFKIKYNLNKTNVYLLIRKKRKSTSNWIMADSSLEFLKSRQGQHNNQNKNILHKFQNKITNEIFKGKQRDFYIKYNLKPESVYCLLHGKYKSTKNWILIN